MTVTFKAAQRLAYVQGYLACIERLSKATREIKDDGDTATLVLDADYLTTLLVFGADLEGIEDDDPLEEEAIE